ncbi:MAG: O-antigen polymerase [Bacteroidota bacterium]
MNPVSLICGAVCAALALTLLRRGTDPLSPGRFFAFIWSAAVGLTSLKLSALQHEWAAESWVLLLAGIGAFLGGTFVAWVLNLKTPLLSLGAMRAALREQEVHEGRLFALVTAGVAVYVTAYALNTMIRGWLPIFVVGSNISRVEFNVSGLTLFLYSAAFILFFTVVYHVTVRGRRGRKAVLGFLAFLTLGSYVLMLQRYQIILAAVVCFVFLYYTTRAVRWRTLLPLAAVVGGFFYGIASLRLGKLVATYTYSISKMRFPKEYAFLTEPYMYVVMNLENFATAVRKADHLTWGYFTFDFVTALAGLKYWAMDYFAVDRSPHLTSSYNTYTAFWWFYSDFGTAGLVLIPFVLGLGIGLLYYRMRSRPGIGSVAAYGAAVFVMFISYFNFPVSFLWFEYNLLAMYLFLRWTLVRKSPPSPAGLPAGLVPAGVRAPGGGGE